MKLFKLSKTLIQFRYLLLGLLLLNLAPQVHAQEQSSEYPEAPVSTAPANAGLTQGALRPDPGVYVEYLNFLNPTILQYSNVETTWMSQNKNERDEVTLRRVEDQLWRQLQIEMNSSILPSTVLSQSISFYRQVQCDKFRTEISGTSRTTIRNETTTRDGNFTQVQPLRNLDSQQQSLAVHFGNEANSISGTNAYTPPPGELISLSGRSVFNIEERTYRTDCIQKRYEFRGVLNAEHFIRYSQVFDDAKLMLVRRGLIKLHANFVSRVQRFNHVFSAVTSRDFVSSSDLKTLGFQNPENLISAMQNELSSLVSVCTFLADAEGLFKEYHYARLARNIEGLKIDARLKFNSIKSAIEVFQSPALKIVFDLDSQKTSYTMFTEKFLQNTFREFYGKDSADNFVFLGQSEDPSLKYTTSLQTAEKSRKDAANSALQNCQAEVKRMIQVTKSADKLSNFSASELQAAQACTSEVTVDSIAINSALSEIQSRGCLLKAMTLSVSYSYSFLFGTSSHYYYRPLVMLCPK